MKLRPGDLSKVSQAARHGQQEKVSVLPSRSLRLYAQISKANRIHILAASWSARGCEEADAEGIDWDVL